MFSQRKTVESMSCSAAPQGGCSVGRLLRSEVAPQGGSCGQSKSKNVQVVNGRKKSAWTDLDRVSFKKFVKESNVKIEKSAWTGLDKVKKGLSAASVFRISSRPVTDLLLTRGAVDATPFAVAFSLTFSLVKNLKMLLQAKRQPGCKIPGRVDDRAY